MGRTDPNSSSAHAVCVDLPEHSGTIARATIRSDPGRGARGGEVAGVRMNVGPADVVLFVGLGVGAVLDLRTGRIPNVLTFPMMAVGVAASSYGHPLPDGLALGVLGVAAAFALHFPLFALGVERGGDAKLMMGLGACVGWREMVETSMWLALLYLPIGLAVLAAQGKLGNLAATARWVAARAQGRDPGPAPEPTTFRTGPVIAVGGLIAWATSWLAIGA